MEAGRLVRWSAGWHPSHRVVLRDVGRRHIRGIEVGMAGSEGAALCCDALGGGWLSSLWLSAGLMTGTHSRAAVLGEGGTLSCCVDKDGAPS